MKTINPAGRTPSNSELNAYGCTCSGAAGNYSAVSGSVPCNVCAYSCASGNEANRAANETQSHNRMTNT